MNSKLAKAFRKLAKQAAAADPSIDWKALYRYAKKQLRNKT